MAFTRRKRNRYLGGGFLLLGIAVLLIPAAAGADLTLYDPEVDVSLSIHRPIFNQGDIAPDIRTGLYFGGYFSMKSPFFTDYFNTKRVYTLFEAGLALNPIENESALFITIPLHVSFGYRIGLGPKFALIPFVGTGLHITYNDYLADSDYNEIFKDRPHASGVISGGLELRWTMMKSSVFRVKFDYGIVFENRVESGYTQYLQVRLPIPFIP
jgi:hypothetical protein